MSAVTETPSFDEPVHIVEYDPHWPAAYEQEVTLLRPALKSFAPDFEHFGSTAVPGMAAKPIIDILVGVDPVPPDEVLFGVLGRLSYSYFGEVGVRGRHHFRKRASVSVNVAMVVRNGRVWEEDLVIRDYLRSHPNDAARYSAAKREIVKEGARSFLKYSEKKAAIVEGILRAARTIK